MTNASPLPGVRPLPTPAKVAPAKALPVTPSTTQKLGNGVFVRDTHAPTLSRTEFDTLTESEKSRFFKDKGKIVAAPIPAKPHKDKAGNTTVAGFRAMTPAKQSAFFAAGNKLVD